CVSSESFADAGEQLSQPQDRVESFQDKASLSSTAFPYVLPETQPLLETARAGSLPASLSSPTWPLFSASRCRRLPRRIAASLSPVRTVRAVAAPPRARVRDAAASVPRNARPGHNVTAAHPTPAGVAAADNQRTTRPPWNKLSAVPAPRTARCA